MAIDLKYLSADPWDAEQRGQRDSEYVHCCICGPDGKIIMDTSNSEVAFVLDFTDEDGPHYHDRVGHANTEFAAAARNAFAGQMEYGWHADFVTKGPWAGAWRVVFLDLDDATAFSGYILNRFPDPVTALATAYEWKKKMEAKT